MSEDRLDKALEAMGNENVSPEELASARARVWDKLGVSGQAACAEFKSAMRDYIEERLDGNRRLLMEDHLGRCPRCRAELAVLKGERKVAAMPRRRAYAWPRWGTWAAAAALVLMALYAGRDRIDTLLAPGGPRATVASVSGGLYRVPEGALQPGAAIGEREAVRTGPGARAVLRLADGSMVEVNERTEFFVRAAWSGQTLHLQRGDVIVQAAKQRRGHLRVLTRDSMASVKGTVFSVSAGLSGTVVSVVEGSVAVAQPGVQVVLGPGEQAATNPALENSVQEAISWSPDAETYLALLSSFVKIEKQIAAFPQPALRTQSSLVPYLPAGVVVYGAVPNLGGTISQALTLCEQQSAENAAFREWWNSPHGVELRQMIDKIQTVTPLLGDEVVFALSTGEAGTKEEIPMVLAEVQPGKSAELAGALDSLGSEAGGTPLPYSVSQTLLVASDSQAHLQWLLARLGQGASSSFAEAIASRYQRGADWLIGFNVESALAQASGSPETQFTGADQMKHLFFEQGSGHGAAENEVTLTFKGPRMGMASWLADSGSGGAAEYIPGDAVFAAYVSTREPRQLFEELTAQLAKSDPAAGRDISEAEAKLGISFANDLAAAFGTESAFEIEGLSLTGPVWVMAALVNDPATLDNTVRRLVDAANAGIQDPAARASITQETVDGRTWMTLTSGQMHLPVTWTYDRGYLIAASDRGAAVRAIATRNGGSPLIWSPAFQQQLPSSAGLHPSAFAWLNTKGAFQGFASLVTNPAIQQLLTEQDPVLLVFTGTAEQIHAASRTRISGLMMDLMLLDSLSRMRLGSQTGTLQQSSEPPGTR